MTTSKRVNQEISEMSVQKEQTNYFKTYFIAAGIILTIVGLVLVLNGLGLLREV
jgi:hypothetical protein